MQNHTESVKNKKFHDSRTKDIYYNHGLNRLLTLNLGPTPKNG